MFCSPCQLLFHREADISGALAHGLLVLVPAGLGLALDHPAPGRLGIAARRGTCSSPLASALARPFCAATAHRCLRTPPGSARFRRLPGRSRPQGLSNGRGRRARPFFSMQNTPSLPKASHTLSSPSSQPRRPPARLSRIPSRSGRKDWRSRKRPPPIAILQSHIPPFHFFLPWFRPFATMNLTIHRVHLGKIYPELQSPQG